MKLFDLSIFQIVLLALFQYYFLSKIIKRFFQRTASIFDIVVLLVMDIILCSLLVVPDLLSYISKFFGIGRGVDFYLYISSIVVLFLLFRIFYKIEKIREDITKLNYQLTLEKHRNSK